MNARKHPLYIGVVCALFAYSSPSLAQSTEQAQGASSSGAQQPKEQLDRIVVTGSRIRSVDVETAQPIFTLTREKLEANGQASVADALQQLTVSGAPGGFSRSSPLSNGEGVGGQYISLRNLGAARTLILVDGKRLPITTAGQQDISAVPTIMVSSIDVQKDGASSTYGSDAIAGVVNINTRKRFNGAEAEAYYGMYTHGDGGKGRVSGILGLSGEKAYATLGVEYRDEKEVWARNRWFSKDYFAGHPETSPVTTGQWGTFNNAATGAAQWYAPNRGSNAIGIANFHRQTAEDTSNPNDQMHLVTPITTKTVYVAGGYDFSQKLRFRADLGFSNREASRQTSGYGFTSTLFNAPMSATSVFNPVPGRDITWRRRGWEVPRAQTHDLTSWRLVTGLEGTVDIGSRYMDWEAGVSHAANNLTITSVGNFNVTNMRAAVGPSFINTGGIAQCGTAAAPISLSNCVPLNPFAGFGTGAVSNSLADPAVQKFLFPTEHATGKTTTRLYYANLSGNMFTLPAGDLMYAVGWENRHEKGEFVPDALAQSGGSTSLTAGPTRGNYSVNEFFTEFAIPLLSGKPFAEELALNLSSRYSDYSSFGNTLNHKASFKWKPLDDLMLRGTWAQGFRAPTISDLYGGGSQTFSTFFDPCDSVNGVAANSAKCLADVGPNYRQLGPGFVASPNKAVQTPIPFVSGSNPLLQPEKSKTFSAGIVYSPKFADGLNISLDWWKINIRDTLTGDSPSDILRDCYVGGVASRCQMFTRDPSTRIVNNLQFGLRNAGFTNIEGYDLSVGYRFKSDGLGQFTINSDSTYVAKYEQKSTNDPVDPVQQLNGFGSNFRLRSNLVLGWERGPLGVNWTTRYFSGVKETCVFKNAAECNMPDYASPGTRGVITPQNRVGGVAFNDVQFRVKTPGNSTVALGVNNVFNRFGPLMHTQPSSSYSYYSGFDIGRYFYMSFMQKF